MYYENKATGDLFIFLSMAQNLETMRNQIVFCHAENEMAIFTISEERFIERYQAIEKAA